MEHRIPLHIQAQPDDETCGPTCLQAVYSHFGHQLTVDEVVREVTRLPKGGTLAVHLARHALARGFRARIHTYNLHVFDPTWFELPPEEMAARLRQRKAQRPGSRLGGAIDAYLQHLELGGEIRLDDLTPRLLRGYLRRGIPILTGLSATYLYRCEREREPNGDEDDIAGDPTGHFVVLCGLDERRRRILVADPYRANPVSQEPIYEMAIERVVCAIMLGISTYDANLLVLSPEDGGPWPS